MTDTLGSNREITIPEREEFRDAIERLSGFLTNYPFDNMGRVNEALYGPEADWSDEVRAEITAMDEDVGYSKYACFKLSNAVLIVGIEESGRLLAEDDHTLLKGRKRWLAMTTEYEAAPVAHILFSRTYTVGASSNLPPIASFKEEQKLKGEDGEYEGFMTEEQREASARLREKLKEGKTLRDEPDMFSELADILRRQTAAAQELSELTGILPNLFTKAAFDRIMRHLQQANADTFEPDTV
ncbi:MAG: hypothetical protein ACHQT9_00015 [Candidatus Saccharimonadales bacterium]